MIEKGFILEPVPIALFAVVLASLAARDWTSWLIVCLSGVVTSATISIRRYRRMLNLTRILESVRQWQNETTDANSVSVDHYDQSKSEPATATTAHPQVRMLTYNLYLRPPLINSNGNDWKDERLEEFIVSVLPNYDIVALQEVFALGSSRQSRLIHAARHYGYKHIVKSIAPPFVTSLKFIDAGLLILSKYPIVEAAGHIYKTGHQIDHYAAKQVIFSRIAITPETHINVFTTHTQASYYENSDLLNEKNNSARLTQIEELCDFIHLKVLSRTDGTSSTNPVVIMGDLNLDARASPQDGKNKGREYQWLEEMFERRFASKPTDALKPSNCEISSSKSKYTVHDLILEQYEGEHPPTYGDATENEEGKLVHVQEPVLTNSADWGCRLAIDYIFLIKSATEPKVRVLPNSTQIQKFEVDFKRKNFPCFQLSDHFAVETTLEIL